MIKEFKILRLYFIYLKCGSIKRLNILINICDMCECFDIFKDFRYLWFCFI